MRLLEEREKRRSLGARPKALESLDSSKKEASKPTDNDKQDGAADLKKSLSYANQLSRGISGLKAVSLLKKLRASEESNSEENVNRVRRPTLKSSSNLEVDLFADARRCIGLFPVKSRHILDFHSGDYEISTDDIPQHPDHRDLAAREFLIKDILVERIKLRSE